MFVERPACGVLELLRLFPTTLSSNMRLGLVPVSKSLLKHK